MLMLKLGLMRVGILRVVDWGSVRRSDVGLWLYLVNGRVSDFIWNLCIEWRDCFCAEKTSTLEV